MAYNCKGEHLKSQKEFLKALDISSVTKKALDIVDCVDAENIFVSQEGDIVFECDEGDMTLILKSILEE